jgi:predicted RNA-binding Zn-ribbon protein involved in translation (DUF1610 family)
VLQQTLAVQFTRIAATRAELRSLTRQPRQETTMSNEHNRRSDGDQPSVADDRIAPTAEVTDDAIRTRAYELYEARGGETDQDVDDGSKPNLNHGRPPIAPREARLTSTPDTPPPQICCPACGKPLLYRQTVYSGVNPIERWDLFACPACGAFEYRHRTGLLRAVEGNLSPPASTARLRTA